VTTDDVPLTPEHEKLIRDTAKACESVADDAARTIETLRVVWTSSDQFRAMSASLGALSAQVAKQAEISVKPMMDEARMLADFQRALPKVMIDFPRLADAVAASPALEAMRAVIEQRAQIPWITLQSETLRTLRLEAERSVASLEAPEAEHLDELLTDLEEVEDAAETNAGRPEARGARAILALMVIGLVLQFLAAQDQIVRNAFEDVALAGAALTKVWAYVAALIAALLAYEKIRPDD
jgi:hypothetical protein